VATIFDTTIQHSGWSGSTFANGGWSDFIPLGAAGQVARSFWGGPINGQATDFAPAFRDSSSGLSQANWVNEHISQPVSGLTIPSPFTVVGSTQLQLFTRVPSPSLQIQVRVVISDTGTTPPPVDSP
jgi:hypothetical protein